MTDILKPEEFNTDKVTVEFFKNIKRDRQHNAFHHQDRDLVEINHKDYPDYCLLVEAVGDMRLRNNSTCNWYDEVPDDNDDFKNDDDIIEKTKLGNGWSFDLQNWFEISIYDKINDEIFYTESVDTYISDSIAHAIDEFEKLIEYYKSLNKGVA